LEMGPGTNSWGTRDSRTQVSVDVIMKEGGAGASYT
jgi:hypothetical protein